MQGTHRSTTPMALIAAILALLPASAMAAGFRILSAGEVNAFPQKTVGLVYCPPGLLTNGGAGTGSLVDSRIALTAGHVIYDAKKKTWMQDTYFLPRNHGSTGLLITRPEKWSSRVKPTRMKVMAGYQRWGASGNLASYNQDVGALVFKDPQTDEPSLPIYLVLYYVARTQMHLDVGQSVLFSDRGVAKLLKNAYVKRVVGYLTSKYSDGRKYKMHTTDNFPGTFRLRDASRASDEDGLNNCWYVTSSISGAGEGLSGAPLFVQFGDVLVFSATVISMSSTGSVGVRAFDSDESKFFIDTVNGR